MGWDLVVWVRKLVATKYTPSEVWFEFRWSVQSPTATSDASESLSFRHQRARKSDRAAIKCCAAVQVRAYVRVMVVITIAVRLYVWSSAKKTQRPASVCIVLSNQRRVQFKVHSWDVGRKRILREFAFAMGCGQGGRGRGVGRGCSKRAFSILALAETVPQMSN